MLFFIAIAGPVKNNENQLYSDIKNLYGEKIIEDDIIEKLYSLELIDWFKNEITKIADQSFSNYILYYVLFEKRWISVESLISMGFPTFRNKIIYTLNSGLQEIAKRALGIGANTEFVINNEVEKNMREIIVDTDNYSEILEKGADVIKEWRE